MKERGMIFNEYQVRALLDGRMTQTRRVIKWKQTRCTEIGEREDGSRWPWSEDAENVCDYWHPCPFGDVGDRIWVRETWALLGNEDGCCVDWNNNLCKADEKSAARIYRASCEQRSGDYGLWSIPDNAYWKSYTEDEKFEGAWRPSVQMPRWASRITLEITGVHVQRLKDADEGHLLDDLGDMLDDCDSVAGRAFNHAEHYAIAGVPVGMCPEMHGFKAWWDKANGAGSFDSNPWVWVIEFKRVEGGTA